MKNPYWTIYSWFCAVTLTVTVVMLACSGCVGKAAPRWHFKYQIQHVRVLAFMSPQCEPCKRAKPFLLSIRANGVDVQIVDVDRNPNLAKRYGVKSVPAFFVYVGSDQPVRTENIWEVLLIVGGRR